MGHAHGELHVALPMGRGLAVVAGALAALTVLGLILGSIGLVTAVPLTTWLALGERPFPQRGVAVVAAGEVAVG